MYDSMYGTWNDVDESPAEVFRRNFYFCAIDDPSSYMQRDVIGVDHIMIESDYPHADSTWPNTQQLVADQIGSSPPTTSSASPGATPASSSATRCPSPCQRDPDAF